MKHRRFLGLLVAALFAPTVLAPNVFAQETRPAPDSQVKPTDVKVAPAVTPAIPVATFSQQGDVKIIHMKPPVIVRSVHPERPVWRFLPDESEPTVRRVVTLHVSKK